MSEKAKIREAIKKISGKNGDKESILCTIDSVDLTEYTCYCIPKNGNADIFNVRLLAKTPTGFLIVPKEGSDVIISFMLDGSGYVSMFSEIEKIILDVDDSIEINTGGNTEITAVGDMNLNGDTVNLNGSNYLGLVRITPLETALNTLQTDINTLKAAVTALMAGYAPIDGGVALGVYNAIVLPQINLTTLENTTVKHGNG